MLIHASAEAIDFCQSLANRRQRPSQAKVRSTTQRRGMTSKPCAVSERLTICIVLHRRGADPVQRATRLRPGRTAIRKDVAQPRTGLADGFPHGWGAVTVLNISRMDDVSEQQATRVNDGMALASETLLAGVIAANAPAFSGFDRLTVDHARSRLSLSAFEFTGRHREMKSDCLPEPIVAPVIDVTLHRRGWWKILRQRPPLTTCRREGEDRVDHLPQIRRPRPAAPSPHRHPRRHQCPCVVGQLACISLDAPLISTASDFSTGHVDPRSASQWSRSITC